MPQTIANPETPSSARLCRLPASHISRRGPMSVLKGRLSRSVTTVTEHGRWPGWTAAMHRIGPQVTLEGQRSRSAPGACASKTTWILAGRRCGNSFRSLSC